MLTTQQKALLDELVNGRTELVFDLVDQGCGVETKDDHGVSLIQHCAYYGDVSAIKFLLVRGESLNSLGDNFDLNGAAFHGHWRLCKFLIENGADVDKPLPDTLESPLHTALCTTDRISHDKVLQVLLSHGANPNTKTAHNIETGGFMRDCRTKGETPPHRAAAFGTEETITLLLKAGATIDAHDANGDTPLSWASWYLRPNSILRLLLYGPFRINSQNQGMRANLIGKPSK